MDQHTGLVSIDRQPQRNTLRSFGLALALLCVGRSAWCWTNNDYTTSVVTSAIGVALASAAWLRPSLFGRPYVLLGVLSFPLRWMIAFTVLAFVYFAVITPVACGVRITRLFRARDKKLQSHWRVSAPRGDKPSYFRQF